MFTEIILFTLNFRADFNGFIDRKISRSQECIYICAMKESKRTKSLYVRVSPEFLELSEMLKVFDVRSISDLLHKALSGYALNHYTGYKQARMVELAHIVGNNNDTPQRRRLGEKKGKYLQQG
jgi:hypothetical protein